MELLWLRDWNYSPKDLRSNEWISVKIRQDVVNIEFWLELDGKTLLDLDSTTNTYSASYWIVQSLVRLFWILDTRLPIWPSHKVSKKLVKMLHENWLIPYGWPRIDGKICNGNFSTGPYWIGQFHLKEHFLGGYKLPKKTFQWPW